jgi:glyoxylase-like metal-dependent hydrolase (beta-lactamase superfamily II)
MHVESFAIGALGCNCSIIADLEAKQAIVIDPGGSAEKILERLAKNGLTVTAIVHTHTHIDHVDATAPLQRATGAAAQIHEADRFLYDLLPVQSAMLGIAVPEKADIEGSLKDDLVVRAGSIELACLHTPGHTPGSMSFVASQGGKTQVFAGDTLFKRSIGRTDLWGGDSDLILSSIRKKLFTLPEDAVVITGHGPATTIGEEKRMNPFVR